MKNLRISATAHGINYLPEYYAREHGLFADAGLDVTAEPRNPWDGVMHDLADGSADVALGGLWVPAMYAHRGRDFVAFAQLNNRFPMTIVTREPVADFEWSWLAGRTLLVPGQGGTAPYEFTAGLMRRDGADPAQTRFGRDLSTAMLVELFVNGLGDAIVADPGTAATLVRAGQGHVAVSLADAGGVMPNSVYYVRRERLDELTPLLVPFAQAIQDATVQVAASTAESHIALIGKEWPDADTAALVDATDFLISSGTWTGVAIAREGVDNWTGVLHDAGLTVDRVAYSDIVTDAISKEVSP
ncbi:ABC transporter substrate-binding protein [Pseudonocardia sp. GCM10023141]|uniref:ABC transporter substrate-binding protein n=1 Tax=Pseudonocardia sp. GCM10023141 TaxID=3252653 RepID=UPI003612E6DB